MTHEFGHFASSVYNEGYSGSTDEGEVASQALELLSLRYWDGVLSSDDAALLSRYELYSIVSSFVESAAYTAFEDLVYGDPALTSEKCRLYFNRCCDDFGIADASQSVGMLSAVEIALIQQLAAFGASVRKAGTDYNVSVIANYCYDLAKAFNGFYHDFPILREEDGRKRALRLSLCAAVAQVIRTGMGLLGIEVPERM